MKGLHNEHHKGMTLLELMIVVAVVAILAAIALPNYRNYVLRSNRAEAKTALLNIRVAEEKWYLQNNTYTGLANLVINATTPGGNYNLDFQVAPTTTVFTARATATGGQTADVAACQVLTIDQTGNRTPNPDPNRCWQ